MFIPFKQNVSREFHLQPLPFFHYIGGDKTTAGQPSLACACVASVSNRVIGRNLELEQTEREIDWGGEGPTLHFLDMLATQANLIPLS